MKERINNHTIVSTDDGNLVLKVQNVEVVLSRTDAIKLRNFLNKYINGDTEEE